MYVFTQRIDRAAAHPRLFDLIPLTWRCKKERGTALLRHFDRQVEGKHAFNTYLANLSFTISKTLKSPNPKENLLFSL